MGAGDWIMATAQVRELHKLTGRQVFVVGAHGRPVWSEVFDHNPRISRGWSKGCVKLINGGGVRPYIDRKLPDRFVWKQWNIAPGEIYLTDDEVAFGAAYAGKILIEPNTKADPSNKAWIFDRWQSLVDRGGDFVQVGAPGARQLRGVQFVETPTFRHACAVLAACRAFVGAEGGLHHAAAALHKPAVVLFSEFISPAFTGYPTHRNLRHAQSACGSRLPCEGCRRSMEAITVDEVHHNLLEITT